MATDETARTGELRRKLEKDPGSRLFAQLAEELRKEGKHEEAISVARTGLEKNPNYPSARMTLARALLDSGRPAEARPELEGIVKAAPDNIMASRLLGEALSELGELAPALQQFEKTLRISPGDKGLIERIGVMKARISLASSAPPAAAPAAVPAPAALPSVLPGAPLPSVFGDAAPAPAVMPAAPLPSIFDAPAPAVTVPAIPTPAPAAVPTPAPIPAPAPVAALPAVATPPAASVALDRDLASGTFSPGALSAGDIQKHFDEVAAGTAPAPVPPAPSIQLPPELPSVAMPADEDLGATTLPLTSLTLADLYLQQGLKAEASAVLSQVLKEEPENAQARSKLAAVSTSLEAIAAQAPSPAAPVAVSVAAPLAPPPLTRAEIRERTIMSLRAFASAVEREAIHQKATERGAI